ncbi:hypothetical protein [Fimbriiglobus ruber]|uniref:Uncharacterized protein n=1 Tax=Fimbriiglobus ruber TaxID=1908690 RepID=A0A225E1D8_9BACT|nr:hypothetical protein [Fimbriiglobus ruber]OWK43826.1 hypothetical protein FRUB_03425 [Fimbriiglobus ruber]
MTSRLSPVHVLYVLGMAATVMISAGYLRAADNPDQAKEEEARRGQQLKAMQRSAEQIILSSADDPKRTFQFRKPALLRFSNPESGTKDGAIYLWSDNGRPQAALKLYTYDNKRYAHAWLSLSESAMVADRTGTTVWSPELPGVKFRDLPDAPRPAETAAERLRQMKTMSSQFSAAYTAEHIEQKPSELRLLSQPLYRYEVSGDQGADGAIFSFVQSTAPVVLLLLETKQVRDERRWRYAFASFVNGRVTARHGGKEVFSCANDHTSRDKRLPFLHLHNQPVPPE